MTGSMYVYSTLLIGMIHSCCAMSSTGQTEMLQNSGKITVEYIKEHREKAMKDKNFKEALRVYCLIDLCVHIDWYKLSVGQQGRWFFLQSQLVEEIHAMYKGDKDWWQLVGAERVKVRDYMVQLMARDHAYCVDGAQLLGGKPLEMHTQLKEDRIQALMNVPT